MKGMRRRRRCGGGGGGGGGLRKNVSALGGNENMRVKNDLQGNTCRVDKTGTERWLNSKCPV